MDSILPYLESIPEDLLKPIELKDGAMILDHYMLTMHYAPKDIGTIIFTPYPNSIRIEIKTNKAAIMRNFEVGKKLKNYFNILGLSVAIYYKNPYQNNANPYGVLI